MVHIILRWSEIAPGSGFDSGLWDTEKVTSLPGTLANVPTERILQAVCKIQAA